MGEKHSAVGYLFREGAFLPAQETKPVRNEFGLDLFQHRGSVYEGKTGLQFCSLQQAEDLAGFVEKHGGIEKVQKLIADSLERTGLSPRYTRPDEKKKDIFPPKEKDENRVFAKDLMGNKHYYYRFYNENGIELYTIYEKDYIDGSGQSYEGIIFTDGVTEVVYYNQLDERWADLPYGTDNIGGYGCGPTSMAIVVSSLTDQTVDPPTMAEWAYQNGYWCSGNGSYHSLIPGAAEGFGLQWESISTDDPQAVVDTLASGKLIVALMSKGHFTSSGHFMVLRGVTSEGKILVADPASKKRSEQEWDISIILDEARKGAAAGGPLWAIY